MREQIEELVREVQAEAEFRRQLEGPTRHNNLLTVWATRLAAIAQGVGEAPQLTEQQWRTFLSVALRHCDLKGSVRFVELQQGLDAALTPQQDTGGDE